MNEKLDYTSSCYRVFHKLSTTWPCLSFDCLRDEEGFSRNDFPMTCYVIAGTQSTDKNEVVIMRWSDLHATEEDSDIESEDSLQDPEVFAQSFAHEGVVNRIRASPQIPRICATWSSLGSCEIHSYEYELEMLKNRNSTKEFHKIMKTENCGIEGYGLGFSPHETGLLLFGDLTGKIRAFRPSPGGWTLDDQNFVGHSASCEDLNFSLKDESLLASASVDRSFAIFDLRNPKKPGFRKTAHDSDVNAVAWNPFVREMLATGGDDGNFKVWDIRQLEDPVASFSWHKKPIVSLSWHVSDEAVLGVASEDDSISFWDLSVEEEKEEEDYPAQLLFLHQGQSEIKELAYHPQLSGVVISTAGSGFNFFRPKNL